MLKNTGRGGKREGAGRPKGSKSVDPQWRRIRISCRIPKYMVDWLESQPVPAGRVIGLALEKFGIEEPPKKAE